MIRSLQCKTILKKLNTIKLLSVTILIKKKKSNSSLIIEKILYNKYISVILYFYFYFFFILLYIYTFGIINFIKDYIIILEFNIFCN